MFRIFKEDNSTAAANGRVYVGITTIGEFIIGDGGGALSPTGTANQQLQVQSGAYIQNNLGIGTTNPSVKLDVIGNTKVKGDFTVSNGELYITRTDGVSGDIFADGGTDGKFGIYNTTNSGLIELITKNSLGINNNILKVTSEIATVNGNLGIGTTAPTSKLHVQGDAYITGVTTSTDFNSTSDINLKTNIQQIDNSLAKVIQIRGVTFDWKDSNRSSAGVIAQEVEKVLPELVNGEETKTVNYNGVIGALVEAVKELKVENDVLRERLDEVYKKVFG